jgi:hypothetical protein
MGAYGMGMGGMGGYMPGMFAGMQQYKQPGADEFSSLGIQSPQQQMFQQVQMRNMMQQQQMAREQQMMAIRSMAMNSGANAAQVGSGFAGPMLMQMGGLRNPETSGAITSGINSLIGAYQNRGQGGPGGMTPMGPQALASQAGQIDPTQIIAAARLKNPNDQAAALQDAGTQLVQMGKSSGNDNLVMAGVRAMDQANKLQLSNGQIRAETAKDTAQGGEATARAASVTAGMTAPHDLGTVISPDGRQWRQYTQYNPDTQKYEMFRNGGGMPIQYVLPQTPGGQQQNGDNYQKMVYTTSTAISRIDQAQKQIASGAPVGDAQDIVSKINDVVGTLGQFYDKSFTSPDASAYLQKTLPGSDFGKWATEGGVTESNMQDMVMTVAAGYAGGKQISRADVTRAEEVLGTASSNPSTLSSVLTAVRQRMIGDVDRQAEVIKSRGGTTQFIGSVDGMNKGFHALVDTPKQTSTGPGTPVSLGNGWTVTQH